MLETNVSSAAGESGSFIATKVIVKKLSPHYFHILILYFFNDDKITIYKTTSKSIEVRSPWYGHTWNDLYYELVAFYSLNIVIKYAVCMRHFVDDIVSPLKPNQNDIRLHPYYILIAVEIHFITLLRK